MKIILTTVNLRRYIPEVFAFSELYNLYEITLARDAIRVPNPPALTPRRSAWVASVKLESKRAAGTLLPNTTPGLFSTEEIVLESPGTDVQFLVKTKNAQNVISRQ